MLADVGSGDMDDLLSAAEKIAAKLGAPAGSEYSLWLKETVGALRAEDRSVLDALRDLGIPLATTNYDGLLEEVTRRPAVTWRQGLKIERALRDEPAILHLHGYWDEPESVVLGIRSYEQVIGDAHAQNVLRALRTMKTLLFIGCGNGLADPNFGALLRWSRQVLSEGEARHFRLCRDSELASVQAQHPREDRIFALAYGADYGDLAPFFRSLVPAASPAAGRLSSPPPSAPPSAPRLPTVPRCFGREDEIRDLVDSLCADPPSPTPILGPAGAGKSTITLRALHAPPTFARFGPRRYFVRCDGAKGREALAAEIARSLGVEPGPLTEPAVFAELERAPIALVLDNLETPWEAETAATEAFIADLCSISGLALAASIRGEQRPFGIPWREAIHAGPLSPEAARSAFLAVTGARLGSDPQLVPLIEAVDRLALAVTLLAYQAESEPDLVGLTRRWQDQRTEMLRASDGDQRLTNLAVSLELSIGSKRMTPAARSLLALHAVLPDGIAHQDLAAVLSEDAEEAAAVLRRVGLAFDSDRRLRTLAPVREHVRRRHPPAVEDQQRAVAHYLELAMLGNLVGTEGGTGAIERLAPEVGNLEATAIFGLGLGLELEGMQRALAACRALAKFASFTGFLASPALQEQTLKAAARLGDPQIEAECLAQFAHLAYYRSDHGIARDLYQQALPLYRRVGKVLGEANCIQGLGDIALDRSDHGTARDLYQQALPLYRQFGTGRGEPNCIRKLGDIAFQLSDHDTARDLYQEALPLYRRIGSMIGEAHCVQSLGDIALDRSDHATARNLIQQALPLYRRLGDARGEADCFCSLGDIAREHADHDTARNLFQKALPLYRRVGGVLGEATCIRSLGDIDLSAGDRAAASSQFNAALALYRRIPEPYSIGWSLVRLARLAPDPASRRELVAQARSAWESIDRADLVEEHLAEFSDPAD